MRLYFPILLILGQAAMAADFRTLDFGQPCSTIEKKEESLGSNPIQSRSDSSSHWYKARAFDADVSIVYLCVDDVLRTGSYLFERKEFDVALEQMRIAYEELTDAHGAPFLDTTPWQYGPGPKDIRSVAAKPSLYVASWRTSRITVTARLLADGDAVAADWRVGIVVIPTEQ